MSKKAWMLTAAVFGSLGVVCVGAPGLTRADVADGLGTWEGTGVTTDTAGKDLGSFSMSMTRTAVVGSVRTDGKLHFADGREIAFWRETVDVGGRKFRIRSNDGAGAGCCFANGVCQSLERGAEGHALAIDRRRSRRRSPRPGPRATTTRP